MAKLGELLVGLDDPIEILRTLRQFSLNPAFNTYAETIATQMITHMLTDSGRTWRQAAREAGRGSKIYEALQKEMRGHIGVGVMSQIGRNAELIKSLPLDIARQVNMHILEESIKGTRSLNIAQQIIAFFPETSKAKAGLIARTETSKASTALTRTRSESLGLNWYIWRTSHDKRVRESHRVMSGVLVKWDNPPSPEQLDHERRSYGPYHAGDIFNCRCYPEPVIDFDMVSWPCKVYHNGSIKRMTRKQFESIA